MGVQTLRGSVVFATAIAAAAVLAGSFVTGTATLADSSTATSGAVTIVASSSSSSVASSTGETVTDATSTGAAQPKKTGSVTDDTADPQSNPLRSVVRDVAPEGQTNVGPRAAGVAISSASAAGAAPGGGTTTTSTKICPSTVTGTPNTVVTPTSANGVEGTTSDDLAAFATNYNQIRIANCLQPIPVANIRYDSCMQDRIFWMADDPSSNPASAWGHTSTAKRSDGLAIAGCDGDLDGGMGFTGSSVATDWWNSSDHRASLFQPAYTGSVADVCIGFAMTHGGYNATPPDEPTSFVRAIAAWETC